MSDAIRAAVISGGVQIVTSLMTIAVALLALNSWRRNALGRRQIELAEQCLQAVWELDEEIASARRLLFLGDFASLKAEHEYLEKYTASYQRAYAAMQECFLKVSALKKQLMLAELYLGELPKTKFKGSTRFFKKFCYNTQDEYMEICSQLFSSLIQTSPITIKQSTQSSASKDIFDKHMNLFHGFMYEYEEDEFSIRLRLTKKTFERHIRKVLRRRTISGRIIDRIKYAITDLSDRQFKPSTINKHPYSKYMADRQPKNVETNTSASSATASEDRISPP